MTDMLRQYTSLLRRSDEISHRALVIGMRDYRPDDDKAAFYAGQLIAKINERSAQ